MSNRPAGGGCIWNDIVDMDLDAKVGQCSRYAVFAHIHCLEERTKHRPLPDGRVTVPEALTFLMVHVALLFALARHLNPVA
jgi:4-hydroxybenzoate polyprenyltransferase